MQGLNEAWEAIRFGGVMVYPLLALGVIALAIMTDKAYVHMKYVRMPDALLTLVETYGFSWKELESCVESLDSRHYFGRFFRPILANREKPAWWVESRAADEAQQIEKSMSRGLWVLETVVTAAPLLGLLGTITGMMNAFKLIGAKGLVDPSGVTGGVAEALIATALGLFIALVCLFAFNFFSRLQSQALDEMERLGTRLIDHIRMDQEGGKIEAS